MTLQETNDLRDVVKEHFEFAFVNLTDEDLIEDVNFNSFVYNNENHHLEYNKLKDNWRSLKRTAKSDIFYSYSGSEAGLHSFSIKSCPDLKFQYLITIDIKIIFNRYPIEKQVVEELLITSITQLKLFLKQDELFKDWDFKLVKYNYYFDKHNLHIIILNKDIYEFLPLQWKLV